MKPNLEEEISNENYSIHVRGVDFGCQHDAVICRGWWFAIESSEEDTVRLRRLEVGSYASRQLQNLACQLASS
jgi:hypothetical protein